jgi:Flp pilus assembly protein TadG
VRPLSQFNTDQRGSVVVIFAVAIVLIVGIVVAATNITSAVSQRSRAQDAIDAAALAAVKLFPAQGVTDAQIEQSARSFLASASDDSSISNAAINVDRGAKEVSISYLSDASNTIRSPLWDGLFKVGAQTKARLGGGTIYPVCILITEPTDNHTLRASDGSQLDLNNCLVQVNTQNWDAVEAKDDSYIHINGGQNCYVGDIHFGDVQPEKMPTCTLFADPFASIGVNVPSNCNFTKFKIPKTQPHSPPLTPGVYCDGLTIEQDATFQPGLYYIKDGALDISGSQTDIAATGVTFVLVGDDAGVTIDGGGKMQFSPAEASAAGKFDGFLFYLDQGVGTEPASVSEITGADAEMSGVIYMAGQHLIVGKNADVKIDGSMVVGYLLGQGGDLNFTGSLPTASAAAAAMQKTLPGSIPVLVH